MRNRLTILVLGVALGLAARGAKWAYDTAKPPNDPPTATSGISNAEKLSAGSGDGGK